MDIIHQNGSKADFCLNFKSLRLKIKFKCKILITIETNAKTVISETVDFVRDKTKG